MTAVRRPVAELLAQTVHAVAAAERPDEALAAVLAAVRETFGASGAAILHVEGSRLVPAASDGLEVAPRALKDGAQVPRGDGYPLVVAGQLEGLLLLAGVSQETLRDDLKLVVMSATLEAAPIAAYLDGCPTLRSEGRRFPVEIEHLAQPDERPLDQQVLAALKRLVQAGLDGHVLVFLPGAGEIRRAREGTFRKFHRVRFRSRRETNNQRSQGRAGRRLPARSFFRPARRARQEVPLPNPRLPR